MSNQATSVQTGDAGEHRDLRARGAPGRLRLSPGRSLWARGCLCALLLTLPAVSPPSAFGQAGQGSASDPPATGAAADQLKESGIKPRLSAKVVETRIDETEASTTLTEEEKKALTEQYRATLTNLEEVENFNAQAAAFAAAIDIAPKEAAAIQAELDATQDQSLEPDVELPESATVADIEHLLARLQAELAAVDAKLGEIDKILEDPQQQPQQLRARLTEIRRELETTEADLQTAAATDEGIVADEARQWALETRRDALRAQLLMLDQQVLSTDARQELATARRALLKATGEQLRTNRAFLENEADRLRRLDAERASAEAEAAERETAGAHALVRDLAEQNADLSDEIAAVTAKLAPLDEQQASVERDTERIEQQYRSAQQRVEAAGLSRALSQALIDLRNQLPDHAALRRRSDARAETIAETTLAQIRYRDELRQLRPVGAFVDELLMAVDVDPSSREQLREEVSKQVERRIDLLERMLSIQQSYLRAVTELDFAASQQLEATERFEAFLAERLLWVRSVPPLTEQDFAAIPDAINWLVSPTHWREVLDTLLNLAARAPAFWLGLAVVALLLWRGRALRAAIRASGEKLRRISTDRFSYTLQALGLTLLAAAPGPLLLALVGWGLSTSLEASAFAKAIGTALIAISLALYYWSAFLLLCMPGGVADQHFRWNSDTLALLRRTFAWGAAVLLPLGFVAAALFEHQDPDFNGTLGRLALAAVNIGLALLTAKLMHPRQGVLQHVLADRPNGWANRLRLLWYPALIAGPVALAGLALTGYLYTSGILLESLVSELWLVLALVVTHEVIVRWLIVTRRSLALKAALERRAQREAERTGPQAQEPERPEVFSIPEPDVDLASLDAQTRRLLNTGIFIAAAVGLWLIWSDVLPALNVLEGVTLWSYTGKVDGLDQQIPVTLADFGLILFIIAIAVVAGKNLPALLEILLLRHTAVSAGSRYTIITLTGYLITAVGVLFVFSTLGLSWGQVQWLIAALGVGIGFGLQEIVANFISGLIILFERPVRVGDIVTIGDTTGVVSKIEIRATTIRNWDKQELLVPNKEFITGRLLNWTLSDQLNRVVITVGVEYGSDTRKALELLREAAAENPRVLDDPKPLITFEGFGDNALTLVLRCYLSSLDYRLDVTTELHQAVDDKLRAAGIGIAFPQRDIHLRSAEPLEVRFSRAGSAPASSAGVDD